MRLNGTWAAYELRMLRANEKARIKDEIQERLDYIRTFTAPQLHFSDGRWETLADADHFTGLFDTLEADIEIMVKRLEFLTQLEKGDDNGNATLEQNESSSDTSIESRVE